MAKKPEPPKPMVWNSHKIRGLGSPLFHYLRPAVAHRRIAISFVAGTLNSAAAFSIATVSSGASTAPNQTALLAAPFAFFRADFAES